MLLTLAVLTACAGQTSAQELGSRSSSAAATDKDLKHRVASTTNDQLLAQTGEDTPTPIFLVSSASEPAPALRYRLYPARHELQPGMAMLRYARAIIVYQSISADERNAWMQIPILSPEATSTDAASLATAVERTEAVYSELQALAMSEDNRWDHRLRDVSGPAVYQYVLPEVQEARTMARVLRIRIQHQLNEKDFEGAITTIRVGFRLAEFVGQGETGIQRLVGIAVHAMMRDALLETIKIPGCPNLYWALATLPPRLINIDDSIAWEMQNITQVLPELRDVHTEIWSEEEATANWIELLSNLGKLSNASIDSSSFTQLTSAVKEKAIVDEALSRLKAEGIDEGRLSKMPSLQIILADATLQVRRMGDDLCKGHLLPRFAGVAILDQEDARYQKWLEENRNSSVAAVIMNTLYPSVRQMKEAETRMLLSHSRLMTLEAIRLYAAQHNGELPKSLDELTVAPALPDPYTNQPFGYRVEKIDDKLVMTLTAAGPRTSRALRELRVAIRPRQEGR